MDLGDLSPSSIEDEKCNKSNSKVKSESGNEVIHLPISINKNSTQCNNHSQQKYDKTGQSAQVTKGLRSKVQNETLKKQEDRSSVCTFGKESASNISLIESNENMETSEFVLSFASTEATCGSSSSTSITSDFEVLDDLEEISEACDSEKIYNLEQPILGSPFTAVGNISNSSSATSFSGIDMDHKFQTTDCAFTGAEGSSTQSDSNSLKTQEIRNNFAAADLPSLPKGMLSNHFKSKEALSKKGSRETNESDKFWQIDKLSSNKNKINVPPLLEKASFSRTKDDETSAISSDFSTTGGLYDYDCHRQNYCQNKDKSVRRKVIREPPTSSKTHSLPTRSSAPSVSSSSTKVGRSLLQISKSLEQTSQEEDDWDIYETHGRRGEVKYFTQKPWVKELISFCYQTEKAVTTPRLDTESLLKEVHHFFQNNRVNADETLNWKEMKHKIITSKYFSYEFSRSHGLLSNEELMKEYLKDLERPNSPYQRNQQKLQGLCRILMEYNVFEKVFINYFEIRIRDAGCSMDSIIAPTNREHHKNFINRRLFLIEKEIGFHVMLELYKKLTREGASFLSILRESRKPYAEEERLLSTSENSSRVPNEFLAGNQSTIYANYLPLNQALSQNEFRNNDCPLSSDGNMHQQDESTIEPSQSFQTDSRESKTSNIVSVSDSKALDSSVTAKSVPYNEKNPMSAGRATIMSRTKNKAKKTRTKSSNEQRVGKDGSNLSAEDVNSEVDKTVGSDE